MTLSNRTSLVALGLVAGLALVGCQGEGAPTKIVEGPAGPAAGTQAQAETRAAEPSQPAATAAASEALDPAIFTPHRTRGGQLRLADERLHDNPAAAGELLRRLDVATETELQVALVEALPRTGGDWLDAILARLPQEDAPPVRKAMVAILARAEPTAALPGIVMGLGDGDSHVRTEAALVAGSIPAAAAGGLTGALEKVLADDHGPARAAAARSLGILQAASAFDGVAALLGDADANVRLQAVRALGRIDQARAAELSAVRSLRTDADAKVARAARAVVGQPSP